MIKFNFVTIDTVIAKFNRDIKSKNCSEADIIAWIGEAMDFIKIPELQQLKVSFEPVINYTVELPFGFQKIQQIARYNGQVTPTSCQPCEKPEEKEEIVPITPKPSPCEPEPCYKPYFDMQWQIIDWSKVPNAFAFRLIDFTPVRLANSNFFGSLVCEEIPEVRSQCRDEYTLEGIETKVLKFSFKEGWVLIAYYSHIVDDKTGFPLIPDVIQLITAIIYYIQWKIAENLAWDGREGFSKIAQEKKFLWNEYIGKARSAIKMPSTVDEYQDIMEQSLKPNINFNSYNNFFNNLTTNIHL